MASPPPARAGAVDVIAPTILPTTDRLGSAGYDPSDYSKWFNGTSCATPYAAGVCALIKSKNPSWTNAQIRTQLLTTGAGRDQRRVGRRLGPLRRLRHGRRRGRGRRRPADGPDHGDVPQRRRDADRRERGHHHLDLVGKLHDRQHRLLDQRRQHLDLDRDRDRQRRLAGLDGAVDRDDSGSRAGERRTATDQSNANFTISVSGGSYATLPYTTGFESGALDAY